MDQYLSTVIVAIITGAFSILAIVIQKRQEKVINKIDEQTMFIEQERGLKDELDKKERDCALLINDIMILILDTNLAILKSSNNADIDRDVYAKSEKLKAEFSQKQHEIEELRKQYKLVLNMTSKFQREIEKVRAGGK